jgi:hypothetical protein
MEAIKAGSRVHDSGRIYIYMKRWSPPPQCRSSSTKFSCNFNVVKCTPVYQPRSPSIDRASQLSTALPVNQPSFSARQAHSLSIKRRQASFPSIKPTPALKDALLMSRKKPQTFNLSSFVTLTKNSRVKTVPKRLC